MKRFLAVLLIVSMLLSCAALPSFADESRTEKLLSSLTTKQKIAQMLMMSFNQFDGNTRAAFAKFGFGAAIYFAANVSSVENTYYQSLEMQRLTTESCGIPLLIATDQEGGSVYRLAQGTALPGNMALGATGDSENARLAGMVIGSELLSECINISLAPVVDVNNNANNPVIGLRSFGDDPQTVGEFGGEFIRGLHDMQVAACAKHFPGHGDTATDSHYGLPVVDKSLSELRRLELVPFKTAIDSGVDMIMTAHILYPQLEKDKAYSFKTGREESLPATMSDDIITKLLKGEMGFEGVVCTDAMNMAGVAATWDLVQSSIIAINAGVDMICAPIAINSAADLAAVDSYINSLAEAVNDGRLSSARVDDACRRILRLKENRGILDFNEAYTSVESAQFLVGCDVNRIMERELAARAVTVVQNNGALPLRLKAGEKVVMFAPYANETGLLAMGWNRVAENKLLPPGAAVEIIHYDSENIDPYKTAIDAADKVIVISEISSAKVINNFGWLMAGPKNIVEYAKGSGKTAIVMSVDKPYDVQFYSGADAVLAVYGCKGCSVDPTEALVGGIIRSDSACGPNITAGIEVVFGVHKAGGKLPVNIPKFDFGSGTYTSVNAFARGYGLEYESRLAERAFADVGQYDYFYEAVDWAAENGITNGTADGFAPYLNVSRGQFITFLWRMAGSPEPEGEQPFTDVEAGAYYEKAVRWAVSEKIAGGIGYGLFAPDKDISREELACFIYNYAKTLGMGFEGDWMFLLDYDDAAEVSSWADEAMHWCSMKGIIKGADGKLLPKNTADRAQAVCMLQRISG